jgi:protocatechuate 3,4-dioxygenase beta subunit
LKDEENILQGKIKKWCAEQKLVKVAMTWVPSPVDEETCGLYQLNPEAKNTVFIYKKRGITEKWVNIDYSNASLKEILKPFSNSNDRRVFFTKKLFTMMPYNRFK